jgi:hypothetical protein
MWGGILESMYLPQHASLIAELSPGWMLFLHRIASVVVSTASLIIPLKVCDDG